MERLDRDGRLHFPEDISGRISRKHYLHEQKGRKVSDVWTDIPPLQASASERLGYPTQKPIALLERIIEASSNPGDLVLDPFCGCGTAVAAAEKLERRWIGIDITHLAIALQKYRLQEMFPDATFRIVGEPESVAGARQLAEHDRFQFEWWALSLVKARPSGGKKKGADEGIDGVITFIDGPKGKAKRILIQVKSGKVGVHHVRDLRGTVEREGAAMGVLITLESPTHPMITEAVSAGFYHSPLWEEDYPAIQILTIEKLMSGGKIQRPPSSSTFKKAQVAQQEGKQGKLGI